MSEFRNAEFTYVPRDWVPIDYTSDVNLGTLLGYTPRAIRADAAGDLVFRCVDSDADRTVTLAAGEVLLGFFTDIKSTSTATIHAAK